MSRRAAIFLPIALLVTLALAFFYRLAFTDLILARGDTYHYFYPYWDARDAALGAGQLPLWTPDLFMGAPLLANPQLGTLYPPNWLTIPLDAPQSIKISILIHVTWAALGTTLLARRALKLDTISALVAGVIFGFGGYIGSHIEQINQLQGLSWMPWLFLLFWLSRERPRVWLPLMGAAWAMQLLSGHTQTVFISGVGLGVVAVVGPHPPAPSPMAEKGSFCWWRGKALSGGSRGASLTDSTAATSEQTQVPLQSIGEGSIGLILILMAAVIGVILALPQLIPTQELISLSNRGGGLSQQEATAFSLNPALIGRGLLPSYEGQPFGEYVGYMGVIGLGLMVMGAMQPDRQRRVWLALLVVGFIFALGRYTPVYLLLARLPGFNLFRVPARWLALVSLGGALLAGLGMQSLSYRRGDDDDNSHLMPSLFIAAGLVALLALSTQFADRAADEVVGPAVPTAIHWLGWGVALAAFTGLVLTSYTYGKSITQRRRDTEPQRNETGEQMRGKASLQGVGVELGRGILLVAVVIELFAASRTLPYNDVTDPGAYGDSRFSIDLMRAFTDAQTPPGRLLSISGLLFDPGDKATLEDRWSRMGISDLASDYAFTATKLKEIVAPNLPLTWDIPSVDGFGGGVLPTDYYTRFTSLMLPEGVRRTVDGRLREVLALPDCRGACIPDDALLDLTNTRYLLVDKVYDVVHRGIFYDTALVFPPDALVENPRAFEGNTLHVVVATPSQPSPTSGREQLAVSEPMSIGVVFIYPDGEEAQLTLGGNPTPLGSGLGLLQFSADEARIPEMIRLDAPDDLTIRALTLVDSRTDAHVQLTPPGWRRVYSADVKIYENLDVLPRAFVVHNTFAVPDNRAGSEEALILLGGVDLSETITLHTPPQTPPQPVGEGLNAVSDKVRFIEYTPTRIVIEVDAAADGWLFMSDAYYPGWRAVDSAGNEREILRADVMFRALAVERGQQTITLTYDPVAASPLALLAGAALWVVVLAVSLREVIGGQGRITLPPV